MLKNPYLLLHFGISPSLICFEANFFFFFDLWYVSQNYPSVKSHLCFRKKGTSPFFWKQLLLSRQRTSFSEVKKIWQLKEISFTDAPLFGFCSVNRIGHSHLLVTMSSLHSVAPQQTNWIEVKSGNIW